MVWGAKAQRIMLERDAIHRNRDNPNYDPQTHDFESEIDPTLTYSENRANFRQKYKQEQSRHQRPVINQRERSIRLLPSDYKQKWRSGKMQNSNNNQQTKEEKYNFLETEKERSYEGGYSGSSVINREMSRGDNAHSIRQRVEHIKARYNPNRDTRGSEWMPDFSGRREQKTENRNLVTDYERIPTTSEREAEAPQKTEVYKGRQERKEKVPYEEQRQQRRKRWEKMSRGIGVKKHEGRPFSGSGNRLATFFRGKPQRQRVPQEGNPFFSDFRDFGRPHALSFGIRIGAGSENDRKYIRNRGLW